MNRVPRFIQDQGDEVRDDFIDRFPIFKTNYDEAAVLSEKKGSKKSSGQSVIPDGTIKLNEKTRKYEGYFDGKVVTEGNSVDKVKNKLASHFNVVEFFGEEA